MLIQTGKGWQFKSEAFLEDFFQECLHGMLGLKVLARQYYINGQVCDLIAVSQDREITIIELKNCEDRHIVQQLTRYFDAVQSEKPFQDIADYSKPINLFAISPGFHRDNLIDRKYTSLDIKFFEYQIVKRKGELIFILINHDVNQSWESVIPFDESQLNYGIPDPPRILTKMFEKSPDSDREGVMALRETLFSYDERIQEIVTSASVLYGKSKAKPCVELKYDSMRERIALLLWLPYKAKAHQSKERIVRLRVWTDWETVFALAHVPKVLGRAISVEEWMEGTMQPVKKLLPPQSYMQDAYENRPGFKERYIKTKSQNSANAHYSSGLAMTFDMYKSLTSQSELSNELPAIVSLALNKWIHRL